jgi:hypothetical protein
MQLAAAFSVRRTMINGSALSRAHEGEVPGACVCHKLATWLKNGAVSTVSTAPAFNPGQPSRRGERGRVIPAAERVLGKSPCAS